MAAMEQPAVDLREPAGWRRTKNQVATVLMWLSFVAVLIPLGFVLYNTSLFLSQAWHQSQDELKWLLLIPPIFNTIRAASFETARWRESDYAPATEGGD